MRWAVGSVRWLKSRGGSGVSGGLDGGFVGGEPDASAVLTDAIALREAGLPPARAWALAGVETDDQGMPLPSAKVWGDDAMVAGSVIAACALARETGMPLARVLSRVDDVMAREQDARDAA